MSVINDITAQLSNLVGKSAPLLGAVLGGPVGGMLGSLGGGFLGGLFG